MIDAKDLVKVTYDELVNHLKDNKRSVMYLKTESGFEQVILYNDDLTFRKGRPEIEHLTKKYIKEGLLFRRRNKLFKDFTGR